VVSASGGIAVANRSGIASSEYGPSMAVDDSGTCVFGVGLFSLVGAGNGARLVQW
jgi:hypothetical protein